MFLDKLRDCNLHKKNCATWNWLSILYFIFIFQNTSHTNEHVAVLMCKDIRSQLKPVSAAKCRSSVVIPYVCEQGINILLTASELQICCSLKVAEFLDVIPCDLICTKCNYQIYAITSCKMVIVRQCLENLEFHILFTDLMVLTSFFERRISCHKCNTLQGHYQCIGICWAWVNVAHA